MQKAVVLLSGGLDSTTCLAIASSKGFECYAISFDYGQRNRTELHAAKRIANHYDVKRHEILRISLDNLGGSAMTDHKIAVADYTGSKEIPATYVPARNTIFLSIALGWAEILEAYDIFIGVSAIDYSGYPDCRPEYIEAYQRMANLATKAGVEGRTVSIHTPLIHLSKAQTIQLGLSLDVDYSMTISCYRANEQGEACGTCDSCQLRKKGFQESTSVDPTYYA